MVLRIGLIQISFEIRRLKESPEQARERRVRQALHDPEQFLMDARERAVRLMVMNHMQRIGR